MSRVAAVGPVLRKKLTVLWVSPVPYVTGAVLHLALGVMYVEQLEARRQAVLQPLFPIAGFLLVTLAPLVTMRTFAEERRLGTLDVLLAVPVRAGGLVVGKWVASWLTVLCVFAPAAMFAAFVAWFGDPDWGPGVSGFAGLALLAAAAAGLGVLASALTASQPVAAIAACFASLLLWFAGAGRDAPGVASLVSRLSFSERLRTFAAGGVDTADVAFFVLLTAVALAASAVAVGAGRGR